MSDVAASIPDVIKRFVPTPFKLITSCTTLETNDLELLEEFDRAGLTPRLSQLAPDFQLRVVREANFNGSDATAQHFFSVANLRVLLFGHGSIVVVDHAQRKCFAFLDHQVSNSSFAREHLPAVLAQPER